MRPRPRNIIPAEKKKRNPLIYVIPALLGIGFILLFGFYLLTVIAFPSLFGKCVAVVEINGELMTDSVPPTLFSDEVPGAEEIAEQIDSLEDRPDVGAVVFVVNSPGGSIVASRTLYSSISSLSKPKVAYFKEVAASGGYYISTPTDYIISEPYAITGSIGVITTTLEASELLDNLGVNITSITSGENKDLGSESEPLTPEQEEILQSLVDLVFEDFKSVILENRKEKLDMDLFEKVLDGRILLGLQAKDIGLVDEVGTKQDAINKAAELARMEGEPRVCEVQLGMGEKGLFDLVSFTRSLLLSTNNYGLQYSLR